MNSSVRRLAVLSAILPLFAFADSPSLVAQTAKRAVRVGDMYRLRNVGAPEISPDGQWVAYTVTSLDSAKDKSNTDVWMASWDGTQVIQLTSSPDAETTPRWSPDGQVPVVPLVARRRQRVAALAARPPRRRSAARERAERRHRRVRVGAGQQAHRAHHARVARHGRFGQRRSRSRSSSTDTTSRTTTTATSTRRARTSTCSTSPTRKRR